MRDAAAKRETTEPQIGGRYRVEEALGRGGMGAVYRVLDESTGRTIALKQLDEEAAKATPEFVTLFQHEYHTLAQLAHPFIIEVYDYGVDKGRPYYTMELLTGSDLREVAPVEWRRTCGLLRDVASSLAILHSRRLVHRDITTRNVRCTDDGRAKLLDFGAMIPMGVVKRVVGTPPFVPPEAVNRQPMDGRADLFSLGALAYFLLTGRHAYPALNIAELRDVWRSRPMQPSGFVSEIPPTLDSLVMSLLCLDRLARPINAAEVIDRLTAIADLPEAEPLELYQAYLITPPLVGRDRIITLFRKFMPHAAAGRGGTVVVEGPPGIGRSRVLSSAVLEGKLAGASVISASAEDAQRGDYGVMQALLEDLLETAPGETLAAAAEEVPVLGHVFPDLHQRLGRPELQHFESPQELRAQVHVALHSLYAVATAHRCLMIAIDDIHRCDEPSLATLVTLSRKAHRLKLVLVVTAENQTGTQVSKAAQMLRDAGTCIDLESLTPEDNGRLIRSMFGDVPNANIVADWVYELSEGNPRLTMELAQHLVDHGIARYEEGRWILPDNLREQVLPQSLEQALDARIEKLTEPARAVAEALSLVTEHAPLKPDHYVFLSDTEDEKVVFAALDELVAAQVLVRAGEHYLFMQPGLVRALHRRLESERRCQIHARLAAVYESGGYDRELVLIHHLQNAGQGGRALQLLVPLLEKAGGLDDPHGFQVQCCEGALKLAKAQNSSPRDQFFLRRHLLKIARKYDRSLLRYADGAAEQLRKDSGLAFWDRLDNALDSSQRMQQCLKMAQERWESATPKERGLNPAEAIQQLGVFAFLMAITVGPTLDAEVLCSLPSLVDPFRTISPVVDLLRRMLEITRDSVLGHPMEDKRRDIDESTRGPAPGVEEEVRKGIHLGNAYYIALEEAGRATQAALKRADVLEKDARFAPHAWQIRTITHLYIGNLQQAQACRERRELLAIQNPDSDVHLISGLLWEARAYGMSGDLMGLKEVLLPIAENAKLYPGWVPLLLSIRGDYHYQRGELEEARADLERMMELAPIGKHFAWQRGIPVLVETLLAMGKAEQARALAATSLEKCLETSPHALPIRELNRVLALADARLGNYQEACERIEETIDKAKGEGVGGVPLGNLYEAGAWIALAAQDEDAFSLYAQLTAAQYRPGRNPALVAKFQRLMEETERCDLRVDSQLEEALAGRSHSGATETVLTVMLELRAAMEQCENREQRAQTALDLLLEQTGATEGYLYLVDAGGLALMAPAEGEAPPGLLSRLAEYLKEINAAAGGGVSCEAATCTADLENTVAEQSLALVDDAGHPFQPVLLSVQRQGSSKIVAMAAFRIRVGTPINPAWNLISTMSEYLMFDRKREASPAGKAQTSEG